MNQRLINASQNGDVNDVRLLLTDPRVDPTVYNNVTIRWAAENGRTEVVRLLLVDPRVDPTVDNWPIRLASRYGHIEVVQLLLADPRVDPTTHNNYAIRWAVENGHEEVVWLLAEQPGILVSTVHNYLQGHEWTNIQRLALMTGALSDSQADLMVWAASIGSLPLVKSLIEQGVDVTYADNSALAAAQHYNHPEIVSYLSNL